MSASNPPSPPKPGTPPASTQPESIVRALEQFITTVMGEQLSSMLEGADEVLFEMANKAGDNNEQRLYLDTLRVIRHEKARLLRSFQDNLKQSFADGRLQRSAANVDLDDLDSWSLRSADDIEETVAVTNLESKAGALYQKEIFELENRLETMAQRGGENVSPKLIMPGRIFEAIRDSLKTMEVEFPVKQVVYRLAERAMLSNMREVYVGANQMLAARGYEPRRGGKPVMAPSRSAGGAAGGGNAGSAPGVGGAPADMGGASFGGGSSGGAPGGWNPGADIGAGMAAWGGGAASAPAPSGPIAWPAGLSAQRLLAGLSTVAGAEMPGPTYTDTQLATEMASAINSLAHGRPVDGWMPASNLVLAGRMFDSLYQDRLLTENAKPLLHRLQYPVMKTALADPAFFENSDHPVRQLVHEIFEMLANVAKPHADDIHRISDMVDNVLKDFEVDAERLGKTENRAPAVSEPQAEKFLAEQEKRLASHNARSVEKMRRLVAMELHLRTTPRDLPDSVRPLLLSGFGPLMVHSMLNGGPSGIAWKDATGLLDRMLDSLDPAKQVAPAVREAAEASINLEISQRLLDIGLTNGKVQRLLAGLVDAYSHRAAGAPAKTPEQEAESAQSRAKAAARHALTTILNIGSWFQVWDASHDQRRWLKLHGYFPAQDAVVFTDFLGENHLRLRVGALAHDLIAGRSAPVDPNPTVRRALGLLPPIAADYPVSDEKPQWTSAAAAAPAPTVH